MKMYNKVLSSFLEIHVIHLWMSAFCTIPKLLRIERMKKPSDEN